jgi:hypothetical protein
MANDINGSLEHARSEAQELHKKLSASVENGRETIADHVKAAGALAQELATSLKATAATQRADVAQHVKDGAAKLEEAVGNFRKSQLPRTQ